MLGLLFKKLTQIFRFIEREPILEQTHESTESVSLDEPEGLLSLEDELKQLANDQRLLDLESINPSVEEVVVADSVVTDEQVPELIAADRPLVEWTTGSSPRIQALPKPHSTSLTDPQGFTSQYLGLRFIPNKKDLDQTDSKSSRSLVHLPNNIAKPQQPKVKSTDPIQAGHSLPQLPNQPLNPKKSSIGAINHTQAHQVSMKRAKAIKTLKVHGLRSLNKKSRRRRSAVSINEDFILSRSQMTEVQVHPQDSVTHRSEKVTQDQARLNELEQNLEYANSKVEETRQALESKMDPQRFKQLNESTPEQVDSAVQDPIKVSEKVENPSPYKIDEERSEEAFESEDSDEDSSPVSESQTDSEEPIEISMLGEPFNQGLAEFAKGRYIDFDKVLTDHMKKNS